MSNSIFSIALSGLRANQAALDTISNNIANATREGYSRQTVNIQSAQPLRIGDVFYGQGVTVASITASRDSFLEAQLTKTAGEASFASEWANKSIGLNQQVYGVTNLGATLNGVQSSLSQLLQSAESLPARTQFLGSLENLAAGFTQAGETLDATRSDIRNSAIQIVDNVNNTLGQIRSLNEQIGLLTNAGKSNAVPNDLIDQRQVAINRLSQQIGVSVTSVNNEISIFSSGIPLLVGNKVQELSVQSQTSDPRNIEIALKSTNGNTSLSSTTFGGQLGGLLSFQNNTLEKTQVELDFVAFSFANTVNQSQAVSKDLDGNVGTNLLRTSPAITYPFASNSGDAEISINIDNAAQLQPTNYVLSRNALGFSVLNNSTGESSSFSSLPISINGISINLDSGTFNIGDQFKLSPFGQSANSSKVLTSNPARVATASFIQATPNPQNIGDVVASTPIYPPNADISLRNDNVNIVFNDPPTSYNIIGSSPADMLNVPYNENQPVTINGWNTTLSGQPQAGDNISFSPSVGNIADGSQGAQLLSSFNSRTLQDNRFSIQERLSLNISTLGSSINQLSGAQTARQSIFENAVNARENFSGVNLDEEAANLIKFQQAYQATAQVIAVAQSVFESLLSLGR